MINSINGLELLIYVIDADTKQLIRRNFTYNGWTNPKDDDGYYYSSILLGGILKMENQSNPRNTDSLSFKFDEHQVTDLGYDFSSIKGNIIEPSYDSELDVYLYPSVAIIYMSKLK